MERVSSAAVDCSHWPVLVIRPPSRSTDRELDEYMGRIESIYRARPEPYAIVLDGRDMKWMTPAQRHRESEFRKRMEPHARQFCRGMAFVLSSELARAALTAMIWLRRPVTQTRVFVSLDEALLWAQTCLPPAG